MAKDTKNINVEINLETWKKLSILSIEKDVHLKDLVSDILDRAVSKKKLGEVSED